MDANLYMYASIPSLVNYPGSHLTALGLFVLLFLSKSIPIYMQELRHDYTLRNSDTEQIPKYYRIPAIITPNV